MELHDRNVLITGGASGIGLEQARQLAANNNVIVGSRDRAKLERAVSGGSRLRALELDVKSEDAARSAIASAVEQFGGLDILVNAAGVLHHAPFADQAAEAVDDEVAVNLVGSMRMTRLALPHLRAANAGAVVFLSSALALAASPGLASYASTKAAIHLIARSLRAEFAGQVRVFRCCRPSSTQAWPPVSVGPSSPRLTWRARSSTDSATIVSKSASARSMRWPR